MSATPQRLSFRRRLHELYYGESPRAVRFRLAWIVVDLIIIGFFIAAPLIREDAGFLIVDYVIAAIVAVDLAARAFAWRRFKSFLMRPNAWIDFFVLLTLLFPQWLFNLGFLRVLRLWTLFNSDVFWSTVARRYDDTRVEHVTRTVATFVTFLFVMTGFVYTGFARVPDTGIVTYVDALYFTVATLSTTGFGDITLPGTWGRILSIIIMASGVTFFVRLAHTLFRPYKVHFRCPTCGLGVHETDAVHCKACGVVLNIPNDEY